MKLSTVILALLFPVTASAQNHPGTGGGGMNEQDMQNMMQQAQKMQTCMQSLDQSLLQAFEQRAQQTAAEVKSLCASGKRDDAQQEAMAFGQEVSANPDTRKMMECSKMMSGMLPAMPYVEQAGKTGKAAAHVCDQ